MLLCWAPGLEGALTRPTPPPAQDPDPGEEVAGASPPYQVCSICQKLQSLSTWVPHLSHWMQKTI